MGWVREKVKEMMNKGMGEKECCLEEKSKGVFQSMFMSTNAFAVKCWDSGAAPKMSSGQGLKRFACVFAKCP